MGFRFPRPGTCRIIALCTGVLFAIAASFSNDAIALVAWLAAVLMGLPLSIVTCRRDRAGAAPARWFTPTVLQVLLRVFGAVVLLVGAGTLGWLVSSLFLRHDPKVSAVGFILQALLSLALIGCGYRLLTHLLPARSIHADTA